MSPAKFEKACPKCGEPMKPSASVCPSCGYTAPVFKYKLAAGCFMLLVLAAMIIVTILRHGFGTGI